ncbi:SAM-dependent methyltransferase [Saccharopolyspora gloriosae]|uniref:SAM-dependent methyltransferase n=1 Tax=Saccharopolyspora gloriosae TaxID=455344 RepID=UPI001FB6908A|nr:SAM-dependent methyltransferase [Saccharopolyspora gloriosae]
MSDVDDDPFPPQSADLTKPSVARVYDWYLGGKANWAIDREFGQHVVNEYPLLRPIAISNRLFLHRAVRHLVARGVHQFIDIGSGVPTMGNTHSVADEVEPGSKVVYVDHEPVAVAHSQVLLDKHGDPERHAVINADFRNPERLWQRAIETGVLDLEQPVAILLIAVLHVKQPGPNGDDISPQVMKRYRELLPPGSYLALSHLTDDGVPASLDDQLVGIKQMYDNSSSPVIWRSQQEIADLFGDFEMLDPGMTWTTDWHPEDRSPNFSPDLDFSESGESAIWAGVGRKQP